MDVKFEDVKARLEAEGYVIVEEVQKTYLKAVKTIYSEGDDLQDVEVIEVWFNGGVTDTDCGYIINSQIYFETNRSIPGWGLNPLTGSWEQDSEELDKAFEMAANGEGLMHYFWGD